MKKNNLRWFLIFAINFSLFNFSIAPALSQTSQPIKTEAIDKSKSYPVVRVVDGDTIMANVDGENVKIRLIGVDTPETVHPQKQVEAYGKEASRFTENLLRGESIYLEYEPGGDKLDKYGRLLAYVYRAPDGLFVNLEIIRQGYGHAYTKYPFQYMEQFREAERKAREAQKGLWATGQLKETTTEDLGRQRYLPLKESTPKMQLRETETSGPSEKQRPDGQATFHGNIQSHIFHGPNCRYYNCGNCTAVFSSREGAISKGYRPCKICKP